MPSRRRLKPWPAWAAAEYETALSAARRLSQEAKQALRRLEANNPGPADLPSLMSRLAQHAREAELAACRVEVARPERGPERWPRWALQALEVIVDKGRGVARQVEAALAEGRSQSRADLERLLNRCLTAGQQMELILLSGPPPETGEG